MRPNVSRILATWILIAGLQGSAALAQRTLVHAGHLFDGVEETFRSQVTLVIREGRFESIRPGFLQPQEGDEVVDLKGSWVMPGLIDMHTHLSSQTAKGGHFQRMLRYPADSALTAVPYLERTLMAGFTTVRDVGGRERVDISLRDAINRGDIVGPRMFVAGQSLAVMGGHGDPTNGVREDMAGVPGPDRGVVYGPESARRATLIAIKRGADVIKITATAGVLSLSGGGGGRLPQFSQEEIAVIVQTAADFGLKVAAHAHGAAGMKRAIRAGVASIEHGTFIDDEAMALMKQHGTCLVPTVIAGKSVAKFAEVPGYYPPVVVPKARAIGPMMTDSLARAYRAGVCIAFGTDAGVFPHGQNSLELEYMVEAGMPEMAVLKSATYKAAELLGKLDELGTVAVGKRADLVAVGSDPSRDMRVMREVAFVMKDGVVYKNESLAP